jgi:DNA-binding MurR/RpiR family transcriptional regulator
MAAGPADQSAAPMLLQRLRTGVAGLPRAQARLAAYIADHLQDVALFGIEELSRRAAVSPASVVRLAHALGYAGYGEMRREAALWFEAHMNALEHLDAGVQVHSLMDAVVASLNEDLRLLAQLRRMIRLAPIEEAADILWSSPRVLVAGERGPSASATLLAFGLSLLREGVDVLSPGPRMAETLASLGETDAVIAFCFPRYVRATVEAVRTVRERGARVVVVTDSAMSPAGQLADLVLAVPHYSRGLPLTSVVPAAALVNGLLSGLARRHPEARQRLATLEVMHARLHTWVVDPTI